MTLTIIYELFTKYKYYLHENYFMPSRGSHQHLMNILVLINTMLIEQRGGSFLCVLCIALFQDTNQIRALSKVNTIITKKQIYLHFQYIHVFVIFFLSYLFSYFFSFFLSLFNYLFICLFVIYLILSFFLSTQCPIDLSCTIPSITPYIYYVSIRSNKHEFTVNGTYSAIHTDPACSVSAVTVSAVNKVGTGDKSDPELIGQFID